MPRLLNGTGLKSGLAFIKFCPGASCEVVKLFVLAPPITVMAGSQGVCSVYAGVRSVYEKERVVRGHLHIVRFFLAPSSLFLFDSFLLHSY